MHRHRRFLAAASIAAFLSLAACQEETIVAQGPRDPQAEQLAKAKPVTLPPAIEASRTYRCKDNSVVDIDFYNDKTSATVRTKDGSVVALKAPEAGQPFVADGYSLAGSGGQVTLGMPGKGSQSCRA